MAAKKDKMIPSEKERKRALKYATPAGTGQMWVTMGIAFIIFGIILLLIPIGLAISEASAQRYDPESIHTATLVFYLLGAFFGFCGCFCVIFGKLAVKAFAKILCKGEINYPVAEYKTPKKLLLQEAAAINQSPNAPLTASTFGNVNVAKVKKMAKDMREGHWDTTHQGIAIASDGTLVDGQHRLLAIVESGVTVRMNVTFNAAKSQHIDSGDIRSMANRVQMSEYDMSWTNNTILSAANLIGRVFAGSNLSHEEALSECLMKYRTQIESATKCIKKATLPGLNSAGTTAAIIVAAVNNPA